MWPFITTIYFEGAYLCQPVSDWPYGCSGPSESWFLFLHYRRSLDFETKKYGLLAGFLIRPSFEYDRRKDDLEGTNNARRILMLDELKINHVMGKKTRTDRLSGGQEGYGGYAERQTGSREDKIRYGKNCGLRYIRLRISLVRMSL